MKNGTLQELADERSEHVDVRLAAVRAGLVPSSRDRPLEGSVSGPGATAARSFAQASGELATAIANARETIAKGGMADLAPLARQLAELFDGIAATADATAETHLLQLLGLAEEIEALTETIAVERGRASDTLARSGQSARAATAYTKTTRL